MVRVRTRNLNPEPEGYESPGLQERTPRCQEWLWVAFAFLTNGNIGRVCRLYKGCPESIQSFWISRESAAWPWCNLAASQKRPYCPSVNSHSPVGLVSRQWDVVDWACVLCDRRFHKTAHFQRRF